VNTIPMRDKSVYWSGHGKKKGRVIMALMNTREHQRRWREFQARKPVMYSSVAECFRNERRPRAH